MHAPPTKLVALLMVAAITDIAGAEDTDWDGGSGGGDLIGEDDDGMTTLQTYTSSTSIPKTTAIRIDTTTLPDCTGLSDKPACAALSSLCGSYPGKFIYLASLCYKFDIIII